MQIPVRSCLRKGIKPELTIFNTPSALGFRRWVQMVTGPLNSTAEGARPSSEMITTWPHWVRRSALGFALLVSLCGCQCDALFLRHTGGIQRNSELEVLASLRDATTAATQEAAALELLRYYKVGRMASNGPIRQVFVQPVDEMWAPLPWWTPQQRLAVGYLVVFDPQGKPPAFEHFRIRVLSAAVTEALHRFCYERPL